MAIKIFLVIIWVLIGVINLAVSNDISKKSYFLVWLVLIANLIADCF